MPCTMSFGFSVSDFVTCAQFAWQVYDALKTGPAECQSFAKEVRFLHEIMARVSENLKHETHHLSSEEREALWQHIFRFEEFCALITDSNPDSKPAYINRILRESLFLQQMSSCILSKIRERIRAASFAKKIPKLQRAVTAQIEKLTSFNVLLIQYNALFMVLLRRR